MSICSRWRAGAKMPERPGSLAEARAFVKATLAAARAAGVKISAPPEEPLQNDCCERGCEFCVFVVYYEALAQWRRALMHEKV